MNEFLKDIPTSELLNLAAQAEAGHLEGSEALIRHEISARLSAVALTATGVYDASQDEYTTAKHQDEAWVCSDETPNGHCARTELE